MFIRVLWLFVTTIILPYYRMFLAYLARLTCQQGLWVSVSSHQGILHQFLLRNPGRDTCCLVYKYVNKPFTFNHNSYCISIPLISHSVMGLVWPPYHTDPSLVMISYILSQTHVSISANPVFNKPPSSLLTWFTPFYSTQNIAYRKWYYDINFWIQLYSTDLFQIVLIICL